MTGRVRRANNREKIAGAVRAELARRSIPVAVIAEPLKLGRTAVYSRMSGEVAFTWTELRILAESLQIPVDVLTGDAVPNFHATSSPHGRRSKP